MATDIDKKHVTKLVQEKIKSGMTKQQVFEELIPENKLGKGLANIIQSFPSNEALKKYKSMHVLFLVLLILLLVILILYKNYAGIFWTCPVIFLVINKQSRYYGWGLASALYGLAPGIQLMLRPPEGVETEGMVIGSMIFLISASIIILGFYLSKKPTPGYVESKDLYTDDECNSRYRLTLKFKE